MDDKNYLVSIITPSYNSENYIGETFKSIQEQTYTNWEWIVIDDYSTDNSLNILLELEKADPRIKIFKNNITSGPGPSRNKGIEKANGDFLTFIDSDDYWDSKFIEKSLTTSIKQNVDFVFASYERWNETFTIQFESFIVPHKVNYYDILKSCPISCLTAFIRIEKHHKIYMPSLPKRQDYVLWLEYLKIIPYAVGIQEPLAKYRIRKNSVSSNKYKVIKYQFLVYYKIQKIGLLKSIYYLINWAIAGFFKYKSIKKTN
ncbi:MAG: glycosyl transferase [Bacteroidetes bacterium HGW-Bacteroidetes-21]|jgi:glycosyltransferase involved in cell wall biosynthesis|nr:MAG: glycosyl transferase [Bacteroidetes bacterium HGW-Bacteroidetes-21]